MNDLKYNDENGEHEYSSWEEKCNKCTFSCVKIGNCKECLKADNEYQESLLNKNDIILETKQYLNINDVVLCKIELEKTEQDVVGVVKAWYQDFPFAVDVTAIISKNGYNYLKGKVLQLYDGSAEIILTTGCEQVGIWCITCLLYQTTILLCSEYKSCT